MIAAYHNTEQSRPKDFSYRHGEYYLQCIPPRVTDMIFDKSLMSWEIFGKRKDNQAPSLTS